MKLIFDIGFYNGGMSKYFIDTFPDVKIIAVEPNIQSINARVEDRDNITILNYAASNVDNQDVTLYVGDVGPVSTISKFWRYAGRFSNMYQNGREVVVKTVKLDTLIDKFGKPDYIKIDAEGHELEIIEGLTQHVDLISFEWTSEDFASKTVPLIGRLQEIGFTKFYYTLEDKMVGDTFYPPADVFRDWLTLKNEIEDHHLTRDEWGMVYCK